MKILKLNAISPLADEIFAGCEYGDDVKNPDGIMVRSAQMADYETGDNLLVVARAGAGTNNIPCDKYADMGITVLNTPGANANAVKELVLCELFLGGRKITDAIEWVKTLKGEADVSKLIEKGKGKFAGREVSGATLGVIGLGAIGVLVANAAVDLGMRVIGCDPYLTTNAALALSPSVKLIPSRDEVYKRADFITVHVPLTPDTKGMFDSDTMAKLKDGCVLINNSRGELVDSKAVIAALESGKLSRYITDFPSEDLIGVQNAICVPHLGASTEEAEDNCAVMAARQIVDYIENGNILHGVNYPDVSMPRSGVQRVCIHHKNIKEILSKILTHISAEGINVENMQDASKGEYAYLVLDTNKPVSEATLQKIREVDGVIRVRTI